jgi:Zn-dependent metalloprotease
MKNRVVRGVSLAVFAWLAGCAEPAPTGSRGAPLTDEDLRQEGALGFYFLPPLVAAPTLLGSPDPHASPVVRIEALDPITGEGALVARYTTSSGPGSETVRWSPECTCFIVNWHTDQFALDPSLTHRIRVRVNHRTVGLADIDVVGTGGELRDVDTGKFIGLVDGRTLPIKFFLATDGDQDGAPDHLDRCPAVRHRDQRDRDGDGVGDACEPRVVSDALAAEILAGEAASLELELASQPGVAIDLTVAWGDGAAETVSGVAHGARVALSHLYPAAGVHPVTATLCAAVGGCQTARLGRVHVLADDTVGADVRFGTGAPEDEIPLARSLARAPLADLRAARGVASALDFEPRRVHVDELHQAHVHVQQRHQGVPVEGGEAIIHRHPDGTISDVTDDLADGVTVDVDRSRVNPADQAIAIAVAQLPCLDCETDVPDASLVIRAFGGEYHLVWRVELSRVDGTAEASLPVIYVDAYTGELRGAYDDLQTATGVSFYSGTVSLTSSKVQTSYYLQDLVRLIGLSPYMFWDADDHWDAENQRAGVDALYGASRYYDYLRLVHGRRAIDGEGGPGTLASQVNPDTKLLKVNVFNGLVGARWIRSERYAEFGTGDGIQFGPLVSLDIVGHELTHGLVQHTAGLIYEGESGALNESWADVFGSMLERWARGGAVTDATWLIGEDAYTPKVAGDALRYMATTHAADESGLGTDDDPDHYSERYVGAGDNGGVHINSGIANHAFYLLAAGGTHHRGGSMTGIGADRAEKIWYRALTTYMTSSTGFSGARAATQRAAADLYGTGSVEHVAVGTAWSLVGVGDTRNLATILGNPGFEDGEGPWVFTGEAERDTANPRTGTYAALLSGNAKTLPGSIYQDVTIPADALSPTLSFWLYVSSTEPSTTTAYDRMEVQIVTPGGALLKTLAVFSNAGRATRGYTLKGEYKLDLYRGATIRLRFRESHNLNYPTTFRIDDVTISP